MIFAVGDSTRLPSNAEHSMIAEYVSHADACSRCSNPTAMRSLCSKGHRLARPISQAFAVFQNQVFSLRDFGESSQIVGIIIPHPYLEIIAKLVTAVQTGMRIKTRASDEREATENEVRVLVNYYSHIHTCLSCRLSLMDDECGLPLCPEGIRHAREIHGLLAVSASQRDLVSTMRGSVVVKFPLHEKPFQTALDLLRAIERGFDISEQAEITYPEVQVAGSDRIPSHSLAPTRGQNATQAAGVADSQPKTPISAPAYTPASTQSPTVALDPVMSMNPAPVDSPEASMDDDSSSNRSQQQVAWPAGCLQDDIAGQQPHPGQNRRRSTWEIQDARAASCGNEIAPTPDQSTQGLIYPAANMPAGGPWDVDAFNPATAGGQQRYMPHRQRWLDGIPVQTYQP